MGIVYKVKKVNKYIEKHRDRIGKKYRLTYHLMPEVGWMNDPNGFCFYNGEYHLFYQHNPYKAKWGRMCWGHATSKDLVKWVYKPVAIVPDKSYDWLLGCFSGSAVVKDNNLYLMYTGVNIITKQKQCVAVSNDGISFRKLKNNPVIKKANGGISNFNFRDPFVFEKNGVYYCIIGAKIGKFGNIALYKSSNLTEWEFVGKVMNGEHPEQSNFFELNGVYECPSFAEIDGQEVLFCSPMNLPRNGTMFENTHSVVYMAGKLDYLTGRFSYDKFEEIDGGFDFYAAQVRTMPDGRTLMSAWMANWAKAIPTQEDGWAGALILPRELSFRNGKLYQAPVREIENYRTNKVEARNLKVENSLTVDGVSGYTLELSVVFELGTAKQVGIKLFQGAEHNTLLYYDVSKQTVVLDRGKSGRFIGVDDTVRRVSVFPENGKIKFRIFLDNTSVEAFINDGASVMSANIYADETDDGISFFALGGEATINEIVKYDIIVLK